MRQLFKTWIKKIPEASVNSNTINNALEELQNIVDADKDLTTMSTGHLSPYKSKMKIRLNPFEIKANSPYNIISINECFFDISINIAIHSIVFDASNLFIIRESSAILNDISCDIDDRIKIEKKLNLYSCINFTNSEINKTSIKEYLINTIEKIKEAINSDLINEIIDLTKIKSFKKNYPEYTKNINKDTIFEHFASLTDFFTSYEIKEEENVFLVTKQTNNEDAYAEYLKKMIDNGIAYSEYITQAVGHQGENRNGRIYIDGQASIRIQANGYNIRVAQPSIGMSASYPSGQGERGISISTDGYKLTLFGEKSELYINTVNSGYQGITEIKLDITNKNSDMLFELIESVTRLNSMYGEYCAINLNFVNKNIIIDFKFKPNENIL